VSSRSGSKRERRRKRVGRVKKKLGWAGDITPIGEISEIKSRLARTLLGSRRGKNGSAKKMGTTHAQKKTTNVGHLLYQKTEEEKKKEEWGEGGGLALQQKCLVTTKKDC